MIYNAVFSILIIPIIIFSCKDVAKQEAPLKAEENPPVLFTDTQEYKDSLAYIMGQFNPEESDLFVEIPREMADRPGLYLRVEVLEAFRQMREQALSDGVSLIIRSATRNFDYQRGIWERKWTGETMVSGQDLSKTIPDAKERALKILLYSSMPGSSRHHWGTDIDLNMFENEWFDYGEGLKIYSWLTENAAAYGFCQPYTDKSGGRTGYEQEKWHWSYKPLSDRYTTFAEAYMKNEMITGFKGAETAGDIDVVKNYVLGISELCR